MGIENDDEDDSKDHGRNGGLWASMSLLTIVFTGCNQPTPPKLTTPSVESVPSKAESCAQDLFLTIDWCGFQTYPIPTVAFASEGRTNDLNGWALHKLPHWDSCVVLSAAECRRLNDLFRVGTLPIAPLARTSSFGAWQSYYVSWSSSSNSLTYKIGWTNEVTIKFIRELQSVLDQDSGSHLNQIIQRIQFIREYRISKTNGSSNSFNGLPTFTLPPETNMVKVQSM